MNLEVGGLYLYSPPCDQYAFKGNTAGEYGKYFLIDSAIVHRFDANEPGFLVELVWMDKLNHYLGWLPSYNGYLWIYPSRIQNL